VATSEAQAEADRRQAEARAAAMEKVAADAEQTAQALDAAEKADQ